MSNKLVHKVYSFEVYDIDKENRSFWAAASLETEDRQGDIIHADGWELGNYLKNPVVVWQHDYYRPPVAQTVEIKTEGATLLFKPKFANWEEHRFADTIFQLYAGAYLRAFSVGFSPIESKPLPGGGTEYLMQELLEISCVTIPANPDALVASIKGLDPDELSAQGIITKDLAAQLKEHASGPDERITGLEASFKEINKRLEALETAAPDDPDHPQAESFDPKPIARQVAGALPKAVEAALEKTITKRINYHLGKVD